MKIDLSQFDGMTPGKWKQAKRDPRTVVVENGHRWIGKSFYELTSPSSRFSCSLDEAIANARAIAALPDLIDELRNTESERAHHAMTAGCLRTDLEYANAEIARLREALAKARAWHESADKALSKSGRGDADYYWQRSQHREQIDETKTVQSDEQYNLAWDAMNARAALETSHDKK